MRVISLRTWRRSEHFKVYSRFEQPHFGMCANVDVTSFYPFMRERGYTFTVSLIYVLARVANSIPEFRYRIHKDDVVEHEVVHPSTTILVEDDLFSFCSIDYSDDFSGFAARAAERIAYTREHPSLKDDPGRDNLLFMTAISWVSFTSFMHPLPSLPPDSVPRFAWGKRFEDGGNLKMPLAVQAHHALMDGLHVGMFYAAVQEFLTQPALFLDNQQGRGPLA